jgi:TM2 domain-containing membrane protein YozV
VSNSKSVKSYTATLLLALTLGYFGAHRFYAGKVGTGLLFLFTVGFFGIGWIIDIFTVAFGNFTDKAGQFIRPKGNE